MTVRSAIYGLIVALIFVLVLLWSGLPSQLRALSTAETDNTQWTVFQLETEFANLSALLAEEDDLVEPGSSGIRLRTDIALSRVDLVSQGLGRNLWDNNDEAQEIILKLDAFSSNAAALIDGADDLTTEDVIRLRSLTESIRPDVRRLAILGVTLGSAAKEAERAEFAMQLRRIGSLAIAVMAGLVGSLIVLDRLLSKARRKDIALRATADRLDSTIKASLDGILIFDQAGTLIDLNDAAETIFGWSRDEISGQKVDTTIAPKHQNWTKQLSEEKDPASTEAGFVDSGRIERTAIRKSGEEFPIELNVTSTLQGGDTIFIAYIRDISERKINQQRLIDARDTAERADKAKSQFLTVMSHEMRTPLNGILGVLDLLKTTSLDDKQERYVEVAAASGEILLENVNEALDITRIESGVMSLSEDIFSLRATVRRVTDVLRTLANEKDLTMDVEMSSSMDLDFLGDGGRINQILTNLIGNAIKFTSEGGIRVKLDGIHGPDQTVARIVVSDTGKGISEDEFEAIFEDFVALTPSSGRQNRGDGLGLSISRKIARMMGGELNVESKKGKGSEFTLTVPLKRATDSERHLEASNSDTSIRAAKHILIVEDNAINRSVLSEMLSGLGYHVNEAENGLEGVKAAELSTYDLIIMDISMPVMDGIEATRTIRDGQGLNQSTYILGLTAHGREEYRQKAKAAGMDEFSTKPLRLSKLKQLLAGIDNTTTASNHCGTSIAHDVIGDLRQTLGDEKTKETADRFFAELSDGIEDLRRKAPSSERDVISETLHKLRGAAGLLGMQSVEKALQQVSAANKSGATGGYLYALEETLTEAETAKSAFSKMFVDADL